jgi:hypothetical protein
MHTALYIQLDELGWYWRGYGKINLTVVTYGQNLELWNELLGQKTNSELLRGVIASTKHKRTTHSILFNKRKVIP